MASMDIIPFLKRAMYMYIRVCWSPLIRWDFQGWKMSLTYISVEIQSISLQLDRGLLNGQCLFICSGNHTFWLKLGLSPVTSQKEAGALRTQASHWQPWWPPAQSDPPLQLQNKRSLSSPPQTQFPFLTCQSLPVSESEVNLSTVFCRAYY